MFEAGIRTCKGAVRFLTLLPSGCHFVGKQHAFIRGAHSAENLAENCCVICLVYRSSVFCAHEIIIACAITTLLYLAFAGNEFDDKAAVFFAEALEVRTYTPAPKS